jgi:hypothetical protein
MLKLAIKVANGKIVHTKGYCTAQPVKVQGANLCANFDMLPFRACDMVLGIHWLRSLGLII